MGGRSSKRISGSLKATLLAGCALAVLPFNSARAQTCTGGTITATVVSNSGGTVTVPANTNVTTGNNVGLRATGANSAIVAPNDCVATTGSSAYGAWAQTGGAIDLNVDPTTLAPTGVAGTVSTTGLSADGL